MQKELLALICFILLGLDIWFMIRNQYTYMARTLARKAISRYLIKNHLRLDGVNYYDEMLISYPKLCFSFRTGEMGAVKDEYKDILRPYFYSE